MKLKAVLDANVFISAFIKPSGPPGSILRTFLENQAFELIVSKPIIQEIINSMTYPRIQKYLKFSKEAIQLTIISVELLSTTVEGIADIDISISDADDKKYLMAAVDGRANYVVSGDQDLLMLQKYEDIQIVTPKFFLDLIGK